MQNPVAINIFAGYVTQAGKMSTVIRRLILSTGSTITASVAIAVAALAAASVVAVTVAAVVADTVAAAILAPSCIRRLWWLERLCFDILTRS